MAVNKEKQQNSLDLLLQTDLKPKQSDLDAMPRVLEFQKVILKKTPVVSTFPSSVNSAQSAVDLHNSLPTTRSIEAISGPDEGNLLSNIKLKATKKPEDFDGSTSSLNTSGLPRKPTVSTSFSPVAVARLKTIKKPEDYDGSTSSLNTTGMPVKSAVTEEAMLSSTSPYGLARLKTVVKESPTKPTPSPTVESPFAVTLKSTKKPQDYQELVQKPQFKTKFEQSQAQAEISKEKEIPKKTVMPAKIVKLKDPNTITVTNASFVPPKLKSAQPLAHLPTQSTLYILKGLRKIYITPVTTITPTDSYVYVDKDTKTVSYWGTGAVKKVKGRDYAGRFERQFKGLKTLNEQTQVKFETGEEVDDGLWESEFEKEIKLWKFDVGSEKIGEGRVSCTLLDDNFVYGLESRDGVYIWQGSLSLAQIRDDAREWADKVKGARNVYVQSAQDTMLLFRDKFTDWSEGMSIAVSQTKNIGAADRTWANYHRAQNVGMVKAVDIQRMWLGPEEIASAIVRPKTPVIDKGTIQLQGWKCYETQSIKLADTELGGVLNSGESYTFKVVYEEDGKVGTAIYYWMGSESNSNMKGHAALLANELDPRRVIKQARIVQGVESNSFIDIFGESKTIMIVKKNVTQGIRIFQIQETISKRIRIQEQSVTNTFHACASFLVLNGEVATIWKSKLHSNDLVTRVYKFLSANMQLHNIKLVDEGSEPSIFWSNNGFTGTDQVFVPTYYGQVKSLPIKTRLFRISSIKLGNATADEIETSLHQASFLANGVFILDAYFELFVWLGSEICQSKESKHELIKLALETALEYTDVVKEQESRLDRSNVYLLRQGQEPLSFKSLFLDWKQWSISHGSHQTLPRSFSFLLNDRKVTDCLNEMGTKKWGLADLQKMLAERVPIGLDPKRMQDYLLDNEFQEYFGMERSVFEAMPEWRKVALRKKVGLV